MKARVGLLDGILRNNGSAETEDTHWFLFLFVWKSIWFCVQTKRLE